MSDQAFPQPQPGVMDIPLYPAAAPDYASGIVELSQNESPFGPSPAAVEALKAAVPLLNRYPDGSGTVLREALARRHGLDPARIVCGSASDSLIILLIQAYTGFDDEVLFPQYSFPFYKDMAMARGARPVTAPERNYRVDVDALIGRAGKRTRICMRANPGNPTGTYITAEELNRLRAGLPPHVLLVVDAAYAEYVTRADYSTGRELVDARRDTVMLRTFSKIYGLAGLRVGWAYCPVNVADALHRVRSLYNLSTAAAAAGTAAVTDQAFVQMSVAHNSRWQARLTEELQALGLGVIPSVANFLLAEFPDAAASHACLSERGIRVRPVAAYGLTRHLRITIGTDAEMQRLLQALRACLGRG